MPVFVGESEQVKSGAVVAEGKPEEGHVGAKGVEPTVIFDGRAGRLPDAFLIAGMIKYFLDSVRNIFVIYPKGQSQYLGGISNADRDY